MCVYNTCILLFLCFLFFLPFPLHSFLLPLPAMNILMYVQLIYMNLYTLCWIGIHIIHVHVYLIFFSFLEFDCLFLSNGPRNSQMCFETITNLQTLL